MTALVPEIHTVCGMGPSVSLIHSRQRRVMWMLTFSMCRIYMKDSGKNAEVHISSLLERCPHCRGWYVQASMELGPEDVSLLERCPHFRGWYVQA